MSETIKTTLVKVTGENEDGQSRQVIISKFVNPYDDLELLHEDTNPNDKNSVAVFKSIDIKSNIKIGYINPALAPRLIQAWKEDLIVTGSVLDVTGRDGDVLGIEAEIFIISSEELRAQTEELNKKTQTLIEKKRYGIGSWRAVIGIVFLLIAIIAFSMVSQDPSILIMAFIFLIPAGILLLPWERWIYDQLSKMFARKH